MACCPGMEDGKVLRTVAATSVNWSRIRRSDCPGPTIHPSFIHSNFCQTLFDLYNPNGLERNSTHLVLPWSTARQLRGLISRLWKQLTGSIECSITGVNMARFQALAVLQQAVVACTLAFVLLCNKLSPVDAYYGLNAWELTSWTDSHATFYGDITGAATMGGACGYGNLWWRGYGLNTAALSDTLLNDGLTCGACFEIKCNVQSSGYSIKWCYASNPSIIVTATNRCPPNWDRPTNNGGWCNPPRTHFDLPVAMFQRMAQPVAGIIPVQYRRVPCQRTGGLKFTLDGNPWFNLVLIWNVAGGGDVKNMQIRGEKTVWYTMRRNWGQYWECPIKFSGQKLSFIVTLGNGHVRVINNLTSQIWYHGQSYEADTNF